MGGEGTTYVLLEEVIRAELAALFPGQQVIESAVFRIARDAELDLDDEGGGDYLEVIEEELRKRRAQPGGAPRGGGRRRRGPARAPVPAPGGREPRRLPDRAARSTCARSSQLVELPALEDLREPP